MATRQLLQWLAFQHDESYTQSYTHHCASLHVPSSRGFARLSGEARNRRSFLGALACRPQIPSRLQAQPEPYRGA